MRSVGTVGGVALAAAFVLLGAPARADDASRARADAVFREGRAAAEAKDFATACARFAESQRLDASSGTLLNLGDCSEHLGKWVAARDYFREAILRLDPSDPREAIAKQRLRALEVRAPRLTVSLAEGTPPGDVACDGRAFAKAALGEAAVVDPGVHTCTFVAPGFTEMRKSVTLREGGAERIVLGVGPAKPAAPPARAPSPDAARPPSDGGGRTAGLAIAGVGFAGLALAGVSGLVIVNEKSRADRGCHDKAGCDADALSAISANKTWLPINTVAWIVGAVGVGAGAYLILSHKDRPNVAAFGARPLPGGAAATATVSFQ